MSGWVGGWRRGNRKQRGRWEEGRLRSDKGSTLATGCKEEKEVRMGCCAIGAVSLGVGG